MIAIADDLGRDVVAAEDGPGQTRGAMSDWRHPIEQVRGLSRPGADGVERLLVCRA